MNVSHKWLKTSLVLEIRKLDPPFLVLKLGQFSLFNSFLDLANFWDLDSFWPFDFPSFPIDSSSLSPNLTTTSLLMYLPEASISGDSIVFNIEVSRIAILLKL